MSKKPRPTTIWRYERVSPSDPLMNTTTQTFDEKIGADYLNFKVEDHMALDTTITVTVGKIEWGKPIIKRQKPRGKRAD